MKIITPNPKLNVRSLKPCPPLLLPGDLPSRGQTGTSKHKPSLRPRKTHEKKIRRANQPKKILNNALTKPMHSHLQTSLKQRYVQKKQTSKEKKQINCFINNTQYKNDPYFDASGKTEARLKFINLLKYMFDSQMHLGHLDKRTHPSMRQYIYNIKNKFAIFDMVYTAHQLKRSLTYLTKAVLHRKTVLFIANKPYLKSSICSAAFVSKFYFVNAKWRGGLITNWDDMSSSVIKLTRFELCVEKGALDYLPKKEVSYLTKRTEKLYGHLNGLRKLVKPQKKIQNKNKKQPKQKMPGVVIIFGQPENRTALREIHKKSLRNILILDTNGDPKQGDDFVIPANSISITSVGFFLNTFLTAIDQGRKRRLSRLLIKTLVITTAQVSKANQFWRFYLKTRSKKFVSNKPTLKKFQTKYKWMIKLSNHLQNFDKTCFYLLKLFMFLLSKPSPYPIRLSESILTCVKKNRIPFGGSMGPKQTPVEEPSKAGKEPKAQKSKLLHQSKQKLNQRKQIHNDFISALTPFEQDTQNKKVKARSLSFKAITDPKFEKLKKVSNINTVQLKSQMLKQAKKPLLKTNKPSQTHYCCSTNHNLNWKPQRRFVQVDRFYKINYNNLGGKYTDFVTFYKAIKTIKKSTYGCLTSLIPLVTHETISSDKFNFNIMAFSLYCHKILNIKRRGSFMHKPIDWEQIKQFQKWQNYLRSKGLKPGRTANQQTRQTRWPKKSRRSMESIKKQNRGTTRRQ